MKRYFTILLVIVLAVGWICQARPVKRSDKDNKVQIKLPSPVTSGVMTLEEVLQNRRSVRHFTDEKVGLEQISQLAWAGQGITDEVAGLRTAPSAGAFYPLILYVLTEKGQFQYEPKSHSLTKITDVDIRVDLTEAAMGQPWVGAPCVFVIAGEQYKLAHKYGNKSLRFMTLEVGHAAQNILLEAADMGLGAVPVGAFDETKVKRYLKIPRSAEPLYIICVGYPKSDQARVSEKVIMRGKRAVFIIGSSEFRDEELFNTMKVLKDAGVKVTIASSTNGEVRGIKGSKVKPELFAEEIIGENFDAIIFIGGGGAREFYNNRTLHEAVQQAIFKRKTVGAIGNAPIILANAGLLNGVGATCDPSEGSTLKKAGAKLTGDDVVTDGTIVTAKGPAAANEFGKSIIKLLREQTQEPAANSNRR